jgi:hypothetical protein
MKYNDWKHKILSMIKERRSPQNKKAMNLAVRERERQSLPS